MERDQEFSTSICRRQWYGFTLTKVFFVLIQNIMLWLSWFVWCGCVLCVSVRLGVYIFVYNICVYMCMHVYV